MCSLEEVREVLCKEIGDLSLSPRDGDGPGERS